MTANDLSKFTTLGVGGPAAKIIHAKTEAELISAVKAGDDSKTPLLILGGGSNLLISDNGFAGTVVKVETTGSESGIT
jgi:UDP-N-acetylmuramate dehydrogenase